MNFWRVVEILGKRKWLILLSIVVASALTAGATRLVGSKWIASVQLVVPQNTAMLKSDTNDDSNTDNQAAQTAVKGQIAVYTAVLKSRNVVEPVLTQLGMTAVPPDFFKNIEITSAGPRLYQLSVTDTSPARATELANALAKQFVIEYKNLSSQQVENAKNLLADQLKKADAKLAEARRNYDKYRLDHQIAVTANNNLEMALSRLKDNRQKRDEATQRLAEAKAQLSALMNEVLPPPPAKPDAPVNPLVASLQKELDQAEQQLTELRGRYTDSWPEVKKAIAHRDDIKARLQQETLKPAMAAAPGVTTQMTAQEQRVLHRNVLQEDIAGYEARIVSLDTAIASAQQEVDRLKGIDGALSALTIAISEQSENRANLVARLSRVQMAVDASTQQNPITVMSEVNNFNPPVNTSQGRTTKLTLIGALCAFLLTSAILLVLESVDRRLKTVTEAEFVLPVRVIAAIPQPMGRVTYDIMARATELEPQSLHAEAYHFLGMHVLNQEPGIRSLMMLSAKAEQGSTTALTNLGITLAQAGKRVILVDANIRTAELHQAFNLPNDVGFTDLITNSDQVSLPSALRQTSVANLSVITSGTQPNNPWELFRSPRLKELSQQLLDQADYVLYDTPSALMFTDALNLAPVVDGAFLCVRALEPLTGGEQRMIELVKAANVTMMGGILTDVPASVIEGYHNYQHYYAPAANGNARLAASAASATNDIGNQRSWIALSQGAEDQDNS